MSCLRFLSACIVLLCVMPFVSCAQDAPADRDALETQCLQALAAIKGHADQQPEAYRIYMNLGRLVELRHRFADAEQYYRSAYDLAKITFGERSDPAVRALYSVGTMQLQQGRCQDAGFILHQVLGILESNEGADPRDIAAVLNSLATLQHTTRNPSKAAALMRRVVQILEAHPSPDPE
jgi:tetratricopeptide (TPR) repeat protein